MTVLCYYIPMPRPKLPETEKRKMLSVRLKPDTLKRVEERARKDKVQKVRVIESALDQYCGA